VNLLLTRDDTIPPAPDHLYGVLEAGTLILQTIERPWIPERGGAACGEPGRSCVPAGTYVLLLHDTPTHPRTFALVNPDLCVYHDPHDIPVSAVGRSDCLIHAGNLASQSEGCILVGLTRSILNGLPDIASSQAALMQFRAAVPWVLGHTLTIEW
jgi:uncharacterized protein DUF5675